MNGDYFAGRPALITGAGAGIGRALALRLAGYRTRLTLWDRDADGLERTAEGCRRAGAEVHACVVDVSDRAAVIEAVVSVGERGGADLLFCLAGTIHTGTLQDSDLSDFDHVMAVNFWGTVNTVKALLPQLLASDRGHVVTVSSAFGLMAVPRFSAYCATKFAVRGFTEALRQELAVTSSAVQVSCAYPGAVRTSIVRNGRFAITEDRDAISGRFDGALARTTPEQAAAAILRGVRRGRPRILVGADAHLVSALVRMTGAGYQRILPRILKRTTTLDRSQPRRP